MKLAPDFRVALAAKYDAHLAAVVSEPPAA